MKTRIIFVRHAEAEGNLYRIFHGWTDSSITHKGHLQAKIVSEKLANTKIDVLYSSSLKRTLQTAEYISKIKTLPIIRTDKLKEINGGDWEGHCWNELSDKWPQEYYTWENNPGCHQMPNGESMKEFQDRLIKEVLYIIKNNKERNICIVIHGTALRALMTYFKRYDIEDMVSINWYDNTSITIVDYEDDKFDVIVEGDNSHLTEGLSTLEHQDWWRNKES